MRKSKGASTPNIKPNHNKPAHMPVLVARNNVIVVYTNWLIIMMKIINW